MKIFGLLGCALMCVASLFGQVTETWRGLTPGTTTPTDIIKLYGKPQKDRLEEPNIASAVSGPANGETIVRSLVYKKVDGLSKLHLMFSNDKLYSMIQYPKNKTRPASDLTSQFNSDFLFLEGLPKKLDFAQLEGQKETTIPKVYPVAYYMLAVRGDRVILALISNGSFKAMWRDGIKKPTLEMFPGYVESIQIFYRLNGKN
ncbi:MAG: hypothetical protein WBD27_14105 [Pyrinomonadaceae bacterium]